VLERKRNECRQSDAGTKCERNDLLWVALDPRDEVDLQGRVFALVHFVEHIGDLKDELVVLDFERFVGSGVGEADGETHGTEEAETEEVR
jgi:hypothetical protein